MKVTILTCGSRSELQPFLPLSLRLNQMRFVTEQAMKVIESHMSAW